MYGTTETQRAVSFLKVPNSSSIDLFKEILPAGRGMKDVQLLVLNKHMKMAGIGELAELFVRSPHMSAGYLGLPDKTAEKFLVNPFTNEPADRFYRTGDLGRYLHNGTVECIGRADDQVKIRGFRIELGEIDTFLGQHPDVRENKTLVMRDRNEEKQIISFFVPKTEHYDLASMRKHLQAKLPSYAVPSIFYPLTKMPLTPNGKIDKSKLPFPDTAIMMLNRTQQEVKEQLTQLQSELMGVWEAVLGRPVHPDDNFFEVGGHSIMATQLTFKLRDQLKQDMPLNLLYQYPTVRQLAKALEDRSANAVQDTTGREHCEVIDLKQELRLDASIAANGRSFSYTTPKTVFLTGATGFLGAFLLDELLRANDTTAVVCLVRAKNPEAGLQRLQSNMRNHLVWKDSYAGRVRAVVGDLARPLLGMEQDEFSRLAEQVDMVIHNGAVVHWVYPYSKLKPMNVNGTIEAMRLATAGKNMASFHFVSSTSVFDSWHYINMTTPVLESDDLSGGAGLSVGYAQSKWVAEQLVLLAISRGVPATIFRPGYVTGHSKTGVTNIDDYLVRLLKGCIQLGKAPAIRNRINMCSVDFVAASIVRAAMQSNATGQCYHVWQPSEFRFKDFFGALKQYGYNVEFVDYLDWRNALMKLTLSSKNNALYPLLHFVLDDLPTRSKTPTLSWDNLKKALEGTGVAPLSVDKLMGTYLAYLVHIGYFELPPRAGHEGVKSLPELALENATIVQRSSNAN
eukprot:TRINITY_DN11128_c0_g1_i1.p1 TRINITY_DN11128_c0_g1~~TRINITY_DN11128_c0_g1_i1.p1  ORF type:complete len:749 (+),score=225.20 TRINITY_DN11128_c0_g1_i1:35-2248(+)